MLQNFLDSDPVRQNTNYKSAVNFFFKQERAQFMQICIHKGIVHYVEKA